MGDRVWVAEVHRASPKSARAPALMPLHPGSQDGGGPRLPWCGLFHPGPEALPTLRGLPKPHTSSARLLPAPREQERSRDHVPGRQRSGSDTASSMGKL